jgi:hypothetical protein
MNFKLLNRRANRLLDLYRVAIGSGDHDIARVFMTEWSTLWWSLYQQYKGAKL